MFQKPGDITNLFLEEEGPGSREFFGELFADRRTAKIDGIESKYDIDEPGAFVGQAIKAIAGTMDWDEIMGKVGNGVSIATANKLSQLENDSQNLPSRTKKRTGRYLEGIAENADIKEEDQNEVITELLNYTFNNPESEAEATDKFYSNLLDDYTLTDSDRFDKDNNENANSESNGDDSAGFSDDNLVAGLASDVPKSTENRDAEGSQTEKGHGKSKNKAKKDIPKVKKHPFLPYGVTMGGDRRVNPDGPKYGYWTGKNWSGGLNPSRNQGKNGTKPPIDSLDELSKIHDECYDKKVSGLIQRKHAPNRPEAGKSETLCDDISICKSACDKEFVKALKALSANPGKWENSPPEGFKDGAIFMRKQAISWFSDD